MLPLSEKMKVHYLIRKKKILMLRLLRSMAMTNLSIQEIVNKEKEICARVAVASQMTKVTATGSSLVAQSLRICLPMQGTRV